MELVRTLRRDYGTIEQIENVLYDSELCCVCRNIILIFYKRNYVVKKYCEDCRDMVDILEKTFPLTQSDDHANDPSPVTVLVDKEQVPDWSECDVCQSKASMRDELVAIFESIVDHQVCALCVAQLGLSVRRQRASNSTRSSSSSSSSSSSNDSSNGSLDSRRGIVYYPYHSDSDVEREVSFAIPDQDDIMNGTSNLDSDGGENSSTSEDEHSNISESSSEDDRGAAVISNDF